MRGWLRVYFHALAGAIGGLFGWALFGEFVPTEWDWWLGALAGGAVMGGMIGYCALSVDALWDRAYLRFLRHAMHGILFGAAGGAAGFWVGDWVNYLLAPAAGEGPGFSQTFRSMTARGLGWMVFGLILGAAEGCAARSWRKFGYGILGGSVGGFCGGAAFGFLIEALAKGPATYSWGQALGLLMLGGCIAGMIALVEEVLKPATLRVLRGWQEGREYPLLKPLSVVGRDEHADVLLLRDMRVEKQHAVIERRADRFLLINNHAPPEQTLVNGKPLHQACEVQDGDRIQLGNVLLRFTVRGSSFQQSAISSQRKSGLPNADR